jgi:hypothetical protein
LHLQNQELALSMTEHPQYLNPDYVAAQRLDGGTWIVGFVFSDKEAGMGAIRAVAELYNTAVGAFGEKVDSK